MEWSGFICFLLCTCKTQRALNVQIPCRNLVKNCQLSSCVLRRCWRKVMRLTWRLENRTTSLLSLLQGVTKAKRRHPGDTVCCHRGIGCRAAVTVQCCWVFDGPPSSVGIWVLPFYQLARRNMANKSYETTSTNFCSHICWQFGFKLALILD